MSRHRELWRKDRLEAWYAAFDVEGSLALRTEEVMVVLAADWLVAGLTAWQRGLTEFTGFDSALESAVDRGDADA